MILPSTRATRSFIRLSERKNVDLPEPDAPINAVIVFFLKPKLTSNNF